MRSTFRSLRETKKPFRSRFKGRAYRAQLQMYRQAQGFVKRFRMWSEMESLVRRHMDPEKSPLLPKNPPCGHNPLLQQIIRQARPGTILVAPYGAGLFGRGGLDCAKVEDPIFITGVSQADADQIRQDAELTGTDILSRSDERDFDTGYWGPILDSASFNGIANNPY